LHDVMWRDPAGIDILLAPPRVEMAEMITARDVEKTISLLRRLYEAIVIDTPTTLSEVTLALLDSSDVVLSIVTTTRQRSTTPSRWRRCSRRSATGPRR